MRNRKRHERIDGAIVPFCDLVLALFAAGCVAFVSVSSSSIAFAGGVKTESGGTNSRTPEKRIKAGNTKIDFNPNPYAAGTSNVRPTSCPPRTHPNPSKTGCVPDLDIGDSMQPGSSLRAPSGGTGSPVLPRGR